MYKKTFLSILSLVIIAGCSGNSSSSRQITPASAETFSGVVNNGFHAGMDVELLAVGVTGQLLADENGDSQVVETVTSDEGRYNLRVVQDLEGPVLLRAASSANTDSLSRAQCQISTGCNPGEQNVPFGESYVMATDVSYFAAIETGSDGRFVVINPVTEMARVLGFTTYIDEGNGPVGAGNTPASGAYSTYGIIMGNTQVADLLGVSEITTIEPANLVNLHLISSSSALFSQSIRYGALLAAWQKLSIEYNNQNPAPANGERITFQNTVIREFIANRGQLYEDQPPVAQTLTLKTWYETAQEVLTGARNFHTAQGRSVPSEVNGVISSLSTQAAAMRAGQLTQAAATLPDDLVENYSSSIARTKAMIAYLTDLGNNFGTPEFRQEITGFYDLIKSETGRLAPEFDRMMSELLEIRNFYLLCTHNQPGCQAAGQLNGRQYQYTAADQMLVIINPTDQPGNESRLYLSQSMVDLRDNPDPSDPITESQVHELFLKGKLESGTLVMDLTGNAGQNATNGSFRFNYPVALAELPLEPAELPNGNGVTVNENHVPDTIELILPSVDLRDTAVTGTADEFAITGSLSTLLIANVDVADLDENTPETDKKGKRYNLADVSIQLQAQGQSRGSVVVDSENSDLRDNAVVDIRATASSAVITQDVPVAYFPDKKYPDLASFFNPREGFNVGDPSPADLVTTRRGVMNFPALTQQGELVEDQTVQVSYLEMDYEYGGLARFVTYPKIGDDDQYFGLICLATPENEEFLVDPEFTREVVDDEGNVTQQLLLSCDTRDKYDGDSSPDNLINIIYDINPDIIGLYSLNGRGLYRLNLPVDNEGNLQFDQGEVSYGGVIERVIMLGVSNMRFIMTPNVVNAAGTDYLPAGNIDISLRYPERDQIEVNAFFSYNPTNVQANPNGNGLPFLDVGTDIESYAIAYSTNANGNEVGEVTMAWSGVEFVDGNPGGDLTAQRTGSGGEAFLVNLGSSVQYDRREGNDTADEHCGFFRRGDPVVQETECRAVAYFAFGGRVTATVREERDGVFVARFTDGTFQVLGN